MQKTYLLIAFIAFSIFTAISCSKDAGGSSVDCSTVSNKAFNADVNPIIQASCAFSIGCHATGSSNGPGALTDYAQIFSARNNIRSAVSSGRMPQTGSLTSAQKNSIICWIDSGAPNN